MTNAGHGFGTTLELAGNAIAELTSIGGVSIDLEAVDVTSHQSASAYREYIGGLLNVSSIPIEGNFYAGDTTGQVALKTLMDSRVTGAFVITLPAAFATTWTFNALATNVTIGSFPVDGKIPFSGSLQPTGKPVLGITASVNITALGITDNVGAATLLPAFAAATYEYVVTTAAAAVTYHITPTFAAGICTVVDGNGGTQTVLTTADTGEIAVSDAGFHTTTATVKETGKVGTVYTFHIQNT